jgi:uncharacterized protein
MIYKTLDAMRHESYKMRIGVNFLPNDFIDAIRCADEYQLPFIQLDHVAGRYKEGELDVGTYSAMRSVFWKPLVLGGVQPKYYHPKPGFDLEESLCEAKARADAIVVTGEGTGKETPMRKIKTFRQLLKEYPLIIGAGITEANIKEQLAIADGAIIGSSFKPEGNITLPVERERVRRIMDALPH